MDWPITQRQHNVITTFDVDTTLGQYLSIAASSYQTIAWSSASRAIYTPIYVGAPVTITFMAFNVGTASGNYDIGIYNWAGTRLVSSGSTAMVAGANVNDITDTSLLPGWYFAALAVDNATAVITASVLAPVGAITAMGLRTQENAFPLPNTATFAINILGAYPLITLHVRNSA
ncbi:MAG: hypothetical protein QXY15_09965 [Candidatus Nitrosotenuis sp.]